MPERRTADRPPRIQPELPREIIPIPRPPDENAQSSFSLRTLLLPLVMIIGYVLVSFLGQGRNLLFILPMGISVIATSVFTFMSFRSERRQREAQKQGYRQLLAELRNEMVKSHEAQRSFYFYNYPNIQTTMQINGDHQDNRSGSRLWERRTSDDDFAALRLGIGSRPSRVIYTIEQADKEVSDLTKDAMKLDADSRIVFDVPVTIPLYKQETNGEQRSKETEETALPPVQVRHAIGIAGEAAHVYQCVRAQIAHYVTFHAPTDAWLYVVGVDNARHEWQQWLLTHETADKNKGGDKTKSYPRPLLPHMPIPRAPDERPYFPVCFEDPIEDPNSKVDREKNRIARFWKLLGAELDRRSLRIKDDADSRASVSLPFMLVIVDMLEPIPANADDWLKGSLLHEVEAEAAVDRLLKEGDKLGAAVLFLVPDRRKVPGGCSAVIEVARTRSGTLDFRYAEVGVNTPRYIGRADFIEHPKELRAFIEQISQWEVRRSYGEGIPDKYGLLEMFGKESIPGLELAHKWNHTRHATKPNPDNKENEPGAEWLRTPIGIMSGGNIRRLLFSADGDGVHGMIAGSTGSGKSELLMTLILSLAVEFDPDIVNFVLIDYKGGQAFEPFKNLPHKVDVVTNLEGAAVDRMFKAIRAELDRRQRINTRTDSKHIVAYRQKGYHLLSDDQFIEKFGFPKEAYPHLFIIIDEFAEMISNNAEYKDQLNSITRLGRALGVSLILAAQRPTGVTDQMRANIKFRICLRVETREESNEMLRRPDAAYLPPGRPGRGYLQIGNENIELIQIAFSGDDYRDAEMADATQLDWHKYREQDVIWPKRIRSEERSELPKLFEVLVERMEQLTAGRAKQYKPWPDPLPKRLLLNGSVPEEAKYLMVEDRDFLRLQAARYASEKDKTTERLLLNPAQARWLEHVQHYRLHAAEIQTGDAPPAVWQTLSDTDWSDQRVAMAPVVGMIDDPENARQQLLQLALRDGHVVLFGAAGWGKTTFLKSLILSLAATHNPAELHIYILDFGGRTLEALENLPHVGAIIRPDEEERVNRLLRKLDSILEERKEIFSRAQVNSFYSYNSYNHQSGKALPAILVVIDNFAEFRSNYENQLPDLAALVREGLSNGMHFVVTGDQTNVLGKLYGQFAQRLTLKLADASEYAMVVGRGAMLEDVAGRGLLAINRTPLQFQVALPAGEEAQATTDETRLIREIAAYMFRAWRGWEEGEQEPSPIEKLQEYEILDNYIEEAVPTVPSTLLPGIDDRNLEPFHLTLKAPPHFLVVGQQQTGKTTALRTMLFSLMYHYSPEQVGIIVIDRLRYLFDWGGQHKLSDLPHVLATVSEPDDFKEIIEHLEYEYNQLPPEAMPKREIFIFIDNLDDFGEVTTNLTSEYKTLLGLLRSRPGRPLLHLISAVSIQALKSQFAFIDLVRRIARYGLALDMDTAEGPPFNARIPRSLREKGLPVGRGFIISSGKSSLLQVATLISERTTRNQEADTSVEAALDRWVGKVQARWRDKPNGTPTRWLPLPTPAVQTTENPALVSSTERTAEKMTSEDLEKLRHFIAHKRNVPQKTFATLDALSLVALLQPIENAQKEFEEWVQRGAEPLTVPPDTPAPKQATVEALPEVEPEVLSPEQEATFSSLTEKDIPLIVEFLVLPQLRPNLSPEQYQQSFKRLYGTIESSLYTKDKEDSVALQTGCKLIRRKNQVIAFLNFRASRSHEDNTKDKTSTEEDKP